MTILLEITLVAVLAVLAARLAPEPWRGRALNALKAWVTVRVFWLLLAHPVTLQDGTRVVAGRLVLDTLKGLDVGIFLLFCALAACTKFVGILASMYRWQILLRGQSIELPFEHIFGSFLIGRFIGTFLPSTAGLDGYKLYDAARFSGRTVEVTATTALEKVIGFSGIFLSFLVALPFGIKIFGPRAGLVAAITVPFCAALIGALLFVLWYPGIVQWFVMHLPIPGKARLEGLVRRVSRAAAAYRDKKGLVLGAFGLSFVVHFTTAAMYYFTTLAIGAVGVEFWPIAFGSSIQILATVLSPFTIAGEGIREAAQYALLGHMIGPAQAIVSAALGFWAAEALTLGGAYFWWFRPRHYTPAYCRVDGRQVDWREAARAAVSLETEEERARRHAAPPVALPPLATRARQGAGLGLGAGALAGLVVGGVEALVIAAEGFGGEAQVLWYGPLVYAALLGGLGLAGGLVLSLLPLEEREIRGWAPALVWLATLVPVGLFITAFRVRRDLYMEQMPPVPVLLALVGGFGALALALFLLGPRLLRGRLGAVARPAMALGLTLLCAAGGAVAARVVAGGGAAIPVPPPVPASLADRPNVILIMVDTLRADHLSCYGGPVATPALCSLAEHGGSRFEGFSHASWTKPSTATLLTSLVPSSHGVMSKASALPESATLISEVLKQHGYATGGIVSNINLAPSFGFDQGYDEYHYLGPDYLFGADESSSKLILYQLARVVYFKIKPGLRVSDFYQSAETVNGVAFDFLERHRHSRFFLFLHYMDCHDPYFAHPWDGTGVARAANQHPDPARADELHRLYEGEIAYLDGQFAHLLEKLHSLGLYDHTVIALVADHGEEFQEHGGWWHGTTLYEEQIHVPVLFKWSPGDPRPTGLDGSLVRLIDVAPTLIARTGAAIPEQMQGIDLDRDLAARPEKDRIVFSEEDHEGNVLRSLRTEQWKLIEANPGNPRGLPEQSLFDVERDRHERDNLYRDHEAVAQELRTHADAVQRLAKSHALGEGEAAKLSSTDEEALRQLGYIE
jgi:arylsulfatase A-like enzyme/uncharacterized membrane protein YbhN (UPF0104 family)